MLRMPGKKGLRLPVLVVALVVVCAAYAGLAAASENGVVILYMNDCPW